MLSSLKGLSAALTAPTSGTKAKPRGRAKSFGNTFRECWKEEGPHETLVKHQHGTGRMQIFSCCVGISPGGPDVWDGGTAFRWCLKHMYISDLESSTKAANQRSDLLNIFKLTTALWDGSSMNLTPANHH